MRFFTATPETFNALRSSIMAQYGMPNNFADEPWQAGVTTLALNQYEYTTHADIVAHALANGATEITEAEYRALQPISNHEDLS